MARPQTKSKEPTFGDLTFEVQKLNTAQFASGKDSEEYKKQHKVSVKLVEFLNSVNGHGYASLSKARSIVALQFRAEKAKKVASLEKAIKNKKGI